MLDIQFIRVNKKKVKDATTAKGFDNTVVDKLLVIDKKRRLLIKKVEDLRAQKNKLTKNDIKKAILLKKEIKIQDNQLNKINSKYDDLMLKIPNISADDVKIGTPEENEIIELIGKVKKFNFPIKDHLEIGKLTETIDIERGTKVAQSGYYYMKGDGALLEFALVQFALNKLNSMGFVPVISPNVAKERNMIGCGFQARSDKERQIYHIENEDLDMIATAEITLVGQHTDEVIDIKNLPKKYVGYSYCYRYEKGSYGKDVKGILRVHEFRKVEMVIFCDPLESDTWHNKLLEIEKEIWRELKIPFQVVKMTTGDLGNAASRKYDLEAWMPSQNKYREVTSTSNTTDFQARRLNIKMKKNGINEYLHTLNGTVLALGRAIIAIYENYQQEDGSVLIPKVLQKWMNKSVIKLKS